MSAYDPVKERFLDEFGEDYGYPHARKNVDEIRATEFKRLNDIVYLDHAGATLYSESQIEDAFKDLTSTLYGNPHSQSSCSSATSDIVDETRREVLSFFNASPEEYKCIFTSGATAALKLVGETFPWSFRSTFMYTMENHNSVLGIREYALNKGASYVAVDVEDNGKSVMKIKPRSAQRRCEASDKEQEHASDTYNLFAFPSECNFSGLRFNLDLVRAVKEESHGFPVTSSCHRSGRWMVLIDAAKGSSTEPPNLSLYKADFVVVSFYKLFGYPTGIGALIARNDAAKVLKKTYFSGGTVAASIADIDYFKRREGIEECFEDGTVPFLSIASLRHGFKILKSLTMPSISRHANSLATYVRNALTNMRHANGLHICTLYDLTNTELLGSKMGPTVSFNLKREDGSWFGYREVEKLASLSNIQLRTGCFCNPGACSKFLGLTHSDLLSNIESGHVCWDDHDILNGKPTGAVRVSFGYMSTYEDAERFLRFIESSFVSQPSEPIVPKPICPLTEGYVSNNTRCYVKSITVYPIKSCAGFNVERWPLNSTGLLHDREWLLKSLAGEILTQKKVPEMAFLTTSIDLNLGLLCVNSPRSKETLQIDLKSISHNNETQVMKVYSQRYEVQGYQSEVDEWFTNAIGRPCKLVRSFGSLNHICSDKTNGICRDLETKLNFVNEAQFLLISEESVVDVNIRLKSKLEKGLLQHPVEVDPTRFRPNLVFSGGTPYVEDEWRRVKIGDTHFKSLGGCNRCQMINLSPKIGTVIRRSNEPLATLASYRRVKGKICFGILLRLCDSIIMKQDSHLAVGEQVIGNDE